MDALLSRGLLQAGLVRLETPELIDRYNRRLEALGIEPTERDHIDVDGIGWSPQVARERRSNFYLCHGIANPFAIVVSPEQYKKPVYFPIFSWMRGMMRLFFEKKFREIVDITSTDGISIDFEEELTSLSGPADLLLLSSITALFDTGGVAEAGQVQSTLIRNFRTGLNCLYQTEYDELTKHVLAHGDMRRRQVAVEPLVYNLFSDFYTVAFDGAAVLRNVDGSDLLVLVNEKTYESVSHETVAGSKVCFVGDPEYRPFTYLSNAGFIGVPIEQYRAEPKILQAKKDLLAAWELTNPAGAEEGHHHVDAGKAPSWNMLTSPQKKALITKHEGKLGLYFELERFAAALRSNRRLPELSPELKLFLTAPVHHLHASTREVLWILLTRREPRNILELYTNDKNHFLEHYHTWGDAKREWAAEYLAKHYIPQMNQ